MTKIQYPLNPEYNKDYDGKEHVIEVQSLMQISETNYYLLLYKDINLKKDTYTFLEKSENGHFYNLPLNNYSKVNMFSKNLKFNTIDEYHLGENIQSKEIILIQNLFYLIDLEKIRKNQQSRAQRKSGKKPRGFFKNYGKIEIQRYSVYDKGQTINIPNKNTSETTKYEQSVEFICYDVNTNNLLAVFGEPETKTVFNNRSIEYSFKESPNKEEFQNNWSNYKSIIPKNKKKFYFCTTDDINKKMYLLYFIPLYYGETIYKFTSTAISGITIIRKNWFIETTPEILFKAVNYNCYAQFEEKTEYHL